MNDDRDERPDDPALEPLAVALRESLAARGIPADAIDETVMLALAWVVERQNDIHSILRTLHGRLERLEGGVLNQIPHEEYRRRVDRLNRELRDKNGVEVSAPSDEDMQRMRRAYPPRRPGPLANDTPDRGPFGYR